MTTPPGPLGPPGVPSRSPSDGTRRTGDALSGPVDSSRPSNPWPRLLAFGAFVLAMIAIAGVCFASFANTPDREIRVRHSEYERGLPRFLPVTSLGFDERNRTFGAYLAVPFESDEALALLSRDPVSGCNVEWQALATSGAIRGIFVDPCSEARYTFEGVALHEGAHSDLHHLDVVREVTGYVVSFEEVTLGHCRTTATDGCSRDGAPVRIEVPSTALPADFGR